MTATATHRSQPALYDVNDNSPPPDGSFAVIAPCDLEEGYTFMVSTPSGMEEDVVPVTVPPGGVREGQIFYSTSQSFLSKTPYNSTHSLYGNSPTVSTSAFPSNFTEWTPLVQPPVLDSQKSSGQQWNDHWYDCFRLGFFHVTLWNACCCPQILAAQVMTRLHLNCMGDPIVSTDETSTVPRHSTPNRTFHRMVVLVISYWCLTTLTAPRHVPTVWIIDETLQEANTTLSDVYSLRKHEPTNVLYHTINLLFGLYTLFILTKLRFHVRRRYGISTYNPFRTCRDAPPTVDQQDSTMACEDCCMAFWCGCCTVAQMARQTASYGMKDGATAVCCSATGLPVDPHTAAYGAKPGPSLVHRNNSSNLYIV
jgi:PLAC8 family